MERKHFFWDSSFQGRSWWKASHHCSTKRRPLNKIQLFLISLRFMKEAKIARSSTSVEEFWRLYDHNIDVDGIPQSTQPFTHLFLKLFSFSKEFEAKHFYLIILSNHTVTNEKFCIFIEKTIIKFNNISDVKDFSRVYLKRF